MSRRPGFAATAGLLGCGAMAAGFAGSLPESLRAITALVVVFLLPAVVLDGMMRRPARPIASGVRVLVSFLAWISILALWSAIFPLLHASFRAYATVTTWLFLVLYGAAVLLPLLRNRQPSPHARISGGLWLAMAACLLAGALVPQRLSVGDDNLDHIGYVRRILSEDSVRPQGVLAMPVDAPRDAVRPDPRKGALHPVVALAAALSSSDPVVVWRWLTVLMFPAVVLAVCAFNVAFIEQRVAVVLAVLLLLLSFHGNLFRLAAAAAHGESLAALWGWTLIALAKSDGRRHSGWMIWALLAAGGVVVHMGVAVHALVLAATVIGFGAAWGMTPVERARVGAAVVTGVLAGLALRAGDLGGTVDPIHAHTQGVLFVAKRWFVASPMEILRLDGLLFLGGLVCIPVLAFAVRSRADARAVVAAAVVPLVISFVPWIATALFRYGSYMVFRSLLNVPVYAAIVVCGRWLMDSLQRRRWPAFVIGLPAAALWIVVFVRPVPPSLASEVRVQARAATTGAPVATELREAVAGLPAGSVILSDPATSYALSAVTSHRFVAVHGQHASPRDAFALERLKAVRDVLSPYAMPASAVNACRRFGVNYVIVNCDPPPDASRFMSVWSRSQCSVTLERMSAMQQSFSRVDSVAGASIYRFETTAPVSWAWAAQDQPVRIGSPSLAPCAVDAPERDFSITGVSVSPASALPGDTVNVTLGYRHDAPSSFDLPEVVYVRFDHEVLKRTHEFPGEKIWRRMRDGREGVRSRFRADFVPGHGVYEVDLWPAGFDLCETFAVVVPSNARQGQYDVRVAVAYDALVPNFHVRDLLYNRDHYSGRACGSLSVVGKLVRGTQR